MSKFIDKDLLLAYLIEQQNKNNTCTYLASKIIKDITSGVFDWNGGDY